MGDAEDNIEIYRAGTPPISRAPEASFTGDVRVGGYFQRPSPSRLVGAAVAFSPGARTPWKVNPVGQTLVVTRGVGWAQCEGEAIIEIRAGDILWCPPGQRHWEGATPYDAMVYVAIQESALVEFGEEVTDQEYGDGPAASAADSSSRA